MNVGAIVFLRQSQVIVNVVKNFDGISHGARQGIRARQRRGGGYSIFGTPKGRNFSEWEQYRILFLLLRFPSSLKQGFCSRNLRRSIWNPNSCLAIEKGSNRRRCRHQSTKQGVPGTTFAVAGRRSSGLSGFPNPGKAPHGQWPTGPRFQPGDRRRMSGFGSPRWVVRSC